MVQIQANDHAEIRKTEVILFNFIMTITERLGKFLKENQHLTLPSIRYFDGFEVYCLSDGSYKGKTLDESLDLFLKSKNY